MLVEIEGRRIEFERPEKWAWYGDRYAQARRRSVGRPPRIIVDGGYRSIAVVAAYVWLGPMMPLAIKNIFVLITRKR